MSGSRARQIRRLADAACREHGVPAVPSAAPYVDRPARASVFHGALVQVQFPRLHREGPRRLARVVRGYYRRHGVLPQIVGGPGRG